MWKFANTLKPKQVNFYSVIMHALGRAITFIGDLTGYFSPTLAGMCYAWY
jgi:hypothetical protein